MKYPAPAARRQRSHGFSLIELMVSLTIGLIIMVAAISAYIGSSGANRMSEAQSRMYEDAQAALNLLSQQLRMAGTNPVQAGRASGTFPSNPVYLATYVGGSVSVRPTAFTLTPGAASAYAIRGCNATFSNITSATTLDALTCAGGTATVPDSIAVSYEADGYNTAATSAGLPTDCVGSSLPFVTATFTASGTTANYAVADNRFYIDNSSAGVPNLYCKGISSSTQPIVENIEDMQFDYGAVSTLNTNTTATVAGYLSAEQVVNETSMAALGNLSNQWGKVITVRICVVARSEKPVLTDTASGAYTKCDGSTDSGQTDLRLRRAYITTVVLRNRRF